jgi:hypothetical protein
VKLGLSHQLNPLYDGKMVSDKRKNFQIKSHDLQMTTTDRLLLDDYHSDDEYKILAFVTTTMICGRAISKRPNQRYSLVRLCSFGSHANNTKQFSQHLFFSHCMKGMLRNDAHASSFFSSCVIYNKFALKIRCHFAVV